jgi:hypothetical protein
MVDICTGVIEYLREFIKVIIILSIFFIITMVIVLLQYKDYIKDHWVEYRCNPLIMPFAGFFGHESGENLNMCMMQIFNGFGGNMLQPLSFMTGQVGGILKLFSGSMQGIKGFMSNFRNLHLNFAGGIMQRIEDVASTLQYTVTKLKAILERLWGIMVTLIYTTFTSIDTMTSVFTGPIGSMAKTFCFDGNNEILMANKELKKIKNIKIHDNIYLGGRVLALLKFTSNNNIMYNYKGVIISGSHLVKDEGIWKRVDKTKYKQKINNYNKKYIYCLVTEKNKIVCNNCIFRDYIETSNSLINNKIKNIILKKLNNSEYNQISKNKLYPKDYDCTGFAGNTLIKMKMGYKKIKDIKIGDITEDNHKVVGFIIQKPIYCKIYKYNNIIVSENQLILYNKKWVRIKDIQNKKKLNIYNYNKNLYNICTSNNLIKTQNYIFRDYEEMSYEKYDNYFDKIIESSLNKKNHLTKCRIYS